MIFCELEISTDSHYAEKFVYPRRHQHNFGDPFVVLGLWYDGFNFCGLVSLNINDDSWFLSNKLWVIKWIKLLRKGICPASYSNPYLAETYRKPQLIRLDVTIAINALMTHDIVWLIFMTRMIEVSRVWYGHMWPYVESRGIHFRIFKIIPNESHVIWKHDAHWLLTNRIQLHNRVKTKNSSW